MKERFFETNKSRIVATKNQRLSLLIIKWGRNITVVANLRTINITSNPTLSLFWNYNTVTRQERFPAKTVRN